MNEEALLAILAGLPDGDSGNRADHEDEEPKPKKKKKNLKLNRGRVSSC